MKIALILIFSACASQGLAQTDSADRMAPVTNTTALPQDNFIVRLARPLAPAAKTPPTAKTRLKEFESDTIGPYVILREAALAGVGQWMNSYREWGQGMRGYGERFGNDLAINAVHYSISYGAETLFHEDNRYFGSGRTSFKGRLLYALASPFQTHHDDGSAGFSYSNVIGVAGAGFISRAWAPPSQRGVAHAFYTMGWAFGEGAALNAVREFVPDIMRMFQKH
jgi:hypothetical protein